MSVSRGADAVLRVQLSGDWTLKQGLPAAEEIVGELASQDQPVSRLVVDGTDLESWGSGLLTYVHGLEARARDEGISVSLDGIPEGARRLLALASAVPAHVTPHREMDDDLSARVGAIALQLWTTFGEALDFIGDTALAFFAALRGRARFRGQDVMHAIEASGIGALGIVALINFLIGAVLAFVGAVQLQQFGATIYVADLVAIGMTRELAALMTGIVMAGRSGASFAAVLGTMTVNEEIDALQTMGLEPTEFLVLPRVLAASLMLPALVAYADLFGLAGGMFVGVSLLNLGARSFMGQLLSALAVRHVVIGLAKAAAFGVVVSMTGCFYGLRCGRSAAAVGEATTKAVVMGIVLVVVVDALATVLLHVVNL